MPWQMQGVAIIVVATLIVLFILALRLPAQQPASILKRGAEKRSTRT
jgi:hypothetical protein